MAKAMKSRTTIAKPTKGSALRQWTVMASANIDNPRYDAMGDKGFDVTCGLGVTTPAKDGEAACRH